MKRICVMLIVLFIASYSSIYCQSYKNRIFKNSSLFKNDSISKKDVLVRIYSLKKVDSTYIGDVYVLYSKEKYFSDLFVLNNKDTIYSIKKNIFSNKKGKDIEVRGKDFTGYKFCYRAHDYFSINLYNNEGKSVSDDITIEWNYISNILEVQKTP